MTKSRFLRPLLTGLPLVALSSAVVAAPAPANTSRLTSIEIRKVEPDKTYKGVAYVKVSGVAHGVVHQLAEERKERRVQPRAGAVVRERPRVRVELHRAPRVRAVVGAHDGQDGRRKTREGKPSRLRTRPRQDGKVPRHSHENHLHRR